MRILGIDPGFERLGIAVLEKDSLQKEKVLYSDCFKTSSKIKFEERLRLLGEEVRRVIKKYNPEILAIETLFLSTNQKTAMRVAEARGVVIYEASSHKIEVMEISPLKIKMAITGYGKADKKQIMKMVKMLVKIDDKINSDDELDAISIGLTAFSEQKTRRLK